MTTDAASNATTRLLLLPAPERDTGDGDRDSAVAEDAIAAAPAPSGDPADVDEDGPTALDPHSWTQALAAIAAKSARPLPPRARTASIAAHPAALHDTRVDGNVAERVASERAVAAARGASKRDADKPSHAPRMGPFQLQRYLASGRTCHVYVARVNDAAGHAREVAIKVLRAEHARDPERVLAFVENASFSTKLRHDNIADIAALGADGAAHYLVMPLLRGVTLRAALRRCAGGLPLAAAVTAIAGCADALHHARAQLSETDPRGLRLVPSRVMACADGATRVLQLERVTAQAPTVAADAAYLAPELARGGAADGRSEVFTLGVMLYELVTGAHPHLEPAAWPGPRTASDRLHTSEVEPPSARSPQVPAELSAVILRALARDPASRYADAHLFGQALHAVADRLALRLGAAAVSHLVQQLGQRARRCAGEPSPRSAEPRFVAASTRPLLRPKGGVAVSSGVSTGSPVGAAPVAVYGGTSGAAARPAPATAHRALHPARAASAAPARAATFASGTDPIAYPLAWATTRPPADPADAPPRPRWLAAASTRTLAVARRGVATLRRSRFETLTLLSCIAALALGVLTASFSPSRSARPPAVARAAARPPLASSGGDVALAPSATPARAGLELAVAARPAVGVVLRIVSQPAGALVSIDGRVVGKTPLTLERPARPSSELLVTARGLSSYRAVVRGDADLELEVHLRARSSSFAVFQPAKLRRAARAR